MPENPYFISKEFRPAQIGVSGGRTSGFLFSKILEAHGGKLPDGVIATYQNTGEECEETLIFLHEIETRWSPIVWLEYKDVFNIEDYPNKAIAIIKKQISENNYLADAELMRWINRENETKMNFRLDRPSYEKLYQISVNELVNGIKNQYDFSLVPEFKCECAGTSGDDLA